MKVQFIKVSTGVYDVMVNGQKHGTMTKVGINIARMINGAVIKATSQGGVKNLIEKCYRYDINE